MIKHLKTIGRVLGAVSRTDTARAKEFELEPIFFGPAVPAA